MLCGVDGSWLSNVTDSSLPATPASVDVSNRRFFATIFSSVEPAAAVGDAPAPGVAPAAAVGAGGGAYWPQTGPFVPVIVGGLGGDGTFSTGSPASWFAA